LTDLTSTTSSKPTTTTNISFGTTNTTKPGTETGTSTTNTASTTSTTGLGAQSTTTTTKTGNDASTSSTTSKPVENQYLIPKNKKVEQVFDGWSNNLNTLINTFKNQAVDIYEWDRLLITQGEEVSYFFFFFFICFSFSFSFQS